MISNLFHVRYPFVALFLQIGEIREWILIRVENILQNIDGQKKY